MVKVALIGTGRWGSNILRTLEEMHDVKIVIVNKRKRANLDLVSQIDAVIVATPGSTHAAVALPYIKQGLSTFIEKPMTTNLRDAKQLQQAASKSGAIIFVGHLHLYNPAWLKVKKLAQDIGQIRALRFEGMNNGPIRDDMSVLWDWGPHGVSLLLDLLGKTPTHIQGWGIKTLRPKTDLYDEVQLRLFFSRNVEAICSLSWLSPTKRMKLTIVGSRYSIVLDDTMDKKVVIYKNGQVAYPRYSKRSPLKCELEEFLSIVKGKKSVAGNNSGRQVVEVLAIAEKSMARSGARLPAS